MSNFQTARLQFVPKAVFCDLDGTLADSMTFLYNVYADFMRKNNLEPTPEEFTGLVGPPISEVVEILQTRYNLTLNTKELYAQYVALFKEYSHKIPLMPGALDFLNHGKSKGTVFYIVTAASKAYVAKFLHVHQLESFFADTITMEDTQFSKPHPAPYQRALQMSTFEPQETIAIEDSSSGVASATGAGIKTFWLVPSDGNTVEWRGDICQVKDWKSVLELVYGK
ncbi:MAG: HAD family phosphatase [Parachlamydiales bacterium]|jgi:HAD superfamily hydrolase (TIGR01509 family)